MKAYTVITFFLHAAFLVHGEQAKPIEVFVYEDRSSGLSIDTVKSSVFQNHFKRSNSLSIRYYESKSSIWIKFKMEGGATDLFLELSSPNLHYVDYYRPDPSNNDTYTHYETGFLRAFISRPIATDRLGLPFTANNQWHFIRIKSDHFLNTELKVMTTDELIKDSSKHIIFYSFYGGIIFIIIAGVIMYVCQGRELHYLFYLGYVIFISTINLTEKGLYYQFLWPMHPQFNYYFPLLPFGVSFCLLMFLKSTFKIDQSAQVLYKFNFWFVTIIPTIPTAFFLIIGMYKEAFIIAEIHGILSCLIVFIINIIAYAKSKENRQFLKLIIVGLCCFCLGVIIYLLAQNEILPINFITENIIVMASAIEVCFFTASIFMYQSSLSKKYYQLIEHQNTELQAGIAQRTTELKQKNEQLLNSLEEKDNLLNIVAHDLKSPLNQAKALSQLITHAAEDVEQVLELSKLIEGASMNGLKLIEELTTIAHLEANNNPIRFEEVRMAEKICIIIKNFEAVAIRKNIAIEFQSISSCYINTYLPYLIRILENILSNALKFSPSGSKIDLALEKKDVWEISVRDQGPGFSEEDKKKMFRKFQRLSAMPTAGEHSSGLGLYITRLLADRINVALLVESVEGKGSIFRLRFAHCQIPAQSHEHQLAVK